ncbi:MAG: right-handed parallel beta-helix repeat-containing protein [Candidatus Micrarchaeota archaeon]|nr:right-handed parallel beta-helix repeat-containing protein [Candidatus Micrarchaeota archaeon]
MYGDSPNPSDPSQQPNPQAPQQPNQQAPTSGAQGTQPVVDQQVEQASQQQYYSPEGEEAIGKLKKNKTIGNLKIVAGAVIVILLIVGGVSLIGIQGPATTTITVTTITQSQLEINGCMNITSPGTYYLSKNINVSPSGGACINVESSNVQLIGNQNKMTGTGPFVGVPPFTYGILLNRVSNVSVSGFALSAFSYGIYLNQTSNSNLVFNNITRSAMSGIFLNRSGNNTVNNNTVTAASSVSGGIGIYQGGNNRVIGDAILNNAFYGMVVNSSSNIFQRDVFSNNPVDLLCPTISSGLGNSNRFSDSSCVTNNYCNFAKCTKTNLPSNVSAVELGGPAISSCGTINSAGTYTLSANLNMQNYLDLSNPLSKVYPCIKVNAPSVSINCRGFSISNAPFGVDASGQFNTTVMNCAFINDTVGVEANSNFNLRVLNDTAAGGSYGIKLTNGTLGAVLNTTATNNTYGLYLNNSGAVILANVNSSGNQYGAYIDKTSGISFSGGRYNSNTRSDLFCTAGTYNGTQNQFQNVNCGSSDCQWATSCQIKQRPPILNFPISSCYLITQPGSYSLSANVIGGDMCINIGASNVTFDCSGHSVHGGQAGTAINIQSGRKEVVVENCYIDGYRYGILAGNSSGITLNNNRMSSPSVGIKIVNTTGAVVTNNRVVNAGGSAGITLIGVNKSTINNNIAFDAVNATDGFIFRNSFNNSISFNNATSNFGNGFNITNSNGNSFFNNSAFTNTALDYYCGPTSGGVYSEKGNGINFGGSKGNCRWLVETNPLAAVQQEGCLALGSSHSVLITSDMVYRFGGTCYTAYRTPTTSGNSSSIDCQGYTILALDGGTFVNIINASGVVVKNCVLKGFTDAIISKGNSAVINNNTVASTSNTAIGVYGGDSQKVSNNKVLNATTGIVVSNSRLGRVLNNQVYNANTSVVLSSIKNFAITNNTGMNGSGGMSIFNSTLNNFQSNLFTNLERYGVSCLQASQNASSQNKDLGGNSCSANVNCNWMTSSSQCLAH